MRIRKWLWPTLFLVTVIIALLAIRIASLPTADTPRTSYGSIKLGDVESKLMYLADSSDYHLIGVFERTATGAVWRHHHVQGGPMTTQLSREDLRENIFWASLGWTYPTHPPTSKVIVLGAGPTFSYIYAYLTDDGEVAAIYVGDT